MFRALDCARDGVEFANKAQNDYLHAQLNAKLGHIYFRRLQEVVDEVQNK